jgi:hypothetical protein
MYTGKKRRLYEVSQSSRTISKENIIQVDVVRLDLVTTLLEPGEPNAFAAKASTIGIAKRKYFCFL